MKSIFKLFLSVTLLTSMAGTIYTDCFSGSSYCSSSCSSARGAILPFSQGENRARDYSIVTRFQNLPNQEDWYWHTDVAIAYNQNFNCYHTQNVIIEPTMYIGLNHWLKGAFVWFKVPIVDTINTLVIDFASGALKTNKIGVADLPLHLGFNFINKDRGYLGFYVRVVFPTGSNIIGYNRWQLGGGFQSRVKLFEKNDVALNLFGDIYVTHLFKKSERRVFDLKANGCFSRYLLLKEFDAETGDYTGNLVNLVDIFTTCLPSRFDWNMNGLIFFDLRYKDWNWDLGYEIKARACEKFDCECISPFDPDKLKGKKYGIKGGTALFGTEADTTAGKSTIKAIAAPDTTPVYMDSTNFKSFIDLNSARIPKAISHKIWSSIGYTWSERDYPISAGLGAEVEFGDKNKALRLWGIWAKAAIAYS